MLKNILVLIIFILIFVNVYAQEDSDNDSLPDDWELAYFGNLEQNANDDFDNDGITNLQELLANTNPKVKDKKSGSSLIILIIILVILIAIIFLYAKLRKKKKNLIKPNHKKVYDYIVKCRKIKMLDEEIKANLINAGWKKEDIEYLFNIK